MNDDIRFKAAIFDMDGTIIDSMGIWKDMAAASFKENDIPVPDDLEHKIFTMTFLEAAGFCIELTGIRVSPEKLVEEWNNKAMGYYKTDIPLKPYAAEFIRYIKGLGMKISLTTSNFYDIAVDVLRRKELLDLFDSITSTQEVTRSKRYPDVFLLSSERLDARPGECIVFEDSYSSVLGARDAGMFVVGVYDRYASHSQDDIQKCAHSYIMTFEELLNNDAFFMRRR